MLVSISHLSHSLYVLSDKTFITQAAMMTTQLNMLAEVHKIPTIAILGITFYSMLKSSAQTNHICSKLKSMNKNLKALAGRNWSADKCESSNPLYCG